MFIIQMAHFASHGIVNFTQRGVRMKSKLLLIALTISLCSGCAPSLTSMQKMELQTFQANGLAVQEKDPGVGAALGILPGFGSFYVREYGFGVLNLLLWPASILWDPISGYQGSQTINYYATKAHVTNKRKKDTRNLEDQLALGTINKDDYIRKKRDIDDLYDGGM